MANARYRERQVLIYLPTREVLDRWKKLAGSTPLSRWIYLQVESSLESTQAPSAPSAPSTDIAALRNENDILRHKIQALELKQIGFTKSYVEHEQAFLERYTHEDLRVSLTIANLLRKGGSWTAQNLAKELQIKNRDEAEAVYNTIEKFVEMDIVKKSPKGYTWK